MEWNPVSLQPAQSFHGRRVGTSSGSSFTMGIMDIAGAIQAQSYRYMMIPDESTPGIVNQTPVGLHTVADFRSDRRVPPNFVKRLLVIRDGDRQRFSGMPDHGQRAQNQVGSEDFLNSCSDNLQRH